MRRLLRTKTWLALFLAVAFLHAGVARAENFSAGDYIIPMDSVLQPYDLGSCNETDYGVFQAYGLVYKLLGEGVTVYWAINQSPDRVGAVDPNYPDITITGEAPLVELHTKSDTRGSTGLGGATTINYFGGPFIISVQNPSIKTVVDNVIATWVADPANYKVNGCNTPNARHISIHVAKKDFDAPVARTMSGTPPRIALLGAGATSILTGYLYVAGLGAVSTGMYGVVTPEEIIAGALDKVGDEYPYQVLWAPHWTGSGLYTNNSWDSTRLVYPGGAAGTVSTDLGSIVALSADNTTITTSVNTTYDKLAVGDNVVFMDLDEQIVCQKTVTFKDKANKKITFSPPVTAAELSRISGIQDTLILIDGGSTTSILKLKAWDANFAVGMPVTVTTKAPYTTVGTGTITALDQPNRKVTINPALPIIPPKDYGFWYPKPVFYGTVHMLSGTTVNDDEVVKKVTAFLEAGNGLFAECASITVFEGSPYGRYLSTRLGGTYINLGGNANFAPNGLQTKSTMTAITWDPRSPFAQIGDFPYYATGGHTHNWKAINSNGTLEPAATYPGPAYYPGTSRIVSLTDTTQSSTSGPATWYNSGWDAAVGGHMWGQKDKGYVVYLGGHKYVSGTSSNANGTYSGIEPAASADPYSDERGGVAGIRIVLNTLLNMKYELQPKEYVRSSPVATGDHQMFLGSFESPGNKGHFRSYNALASDIKNPAYTFYDAASLFPAADGRRLYYQGPSSTLFKPFTTTNLYTDYAGAFTGMTDQAKEALVNRYRGKAAKVNPVTGAYQVDGSGNLVYEESWKLGPVQYSAPALVGYSSNVEGGATRPRVAYVVDGWGVLHAFFAPEIPRPPDASPAITATWTAADFASAVAANPSKYKLSGTLNAGGAGNVALTALEPGAEIYGWVTDNQELNYLKDFGTWHTKGISASPKSADVMVEVSTGVRKYRTLLVIPQGKGTTNVPVLDVTDPLKPTLRHVLKSTSAGDAYSHIGHSRSFAIGRVYVNDGTTVGLRNYLFYATESMEKSGGVPVPGITMAAVDLESAAVAWRVTMPYDNTSIPNDIPAGPSIVDANGDGVIDYVFAGDYEGRVWGLHASQTGKTDSYGNPVPGGASIFGEIYSLPVPVANLGATQPVGVVPTVYKEGYRLNVVFGTGGTDWAPSGADVFYNVYSYDANNALSSPSLSSGGATQQWVYTLPAGEKVYAGIVKSGPYLFLGTAYGTALNQSDPAADIPATMAQSGHLIVLQSTGATTDSDGNPITRQVASVEVGKMVAAVDVRHGKVYYTALGASGAGTTDTATRVAIRNITGLGSANASLIGNQGAPGNRIEVLYWNEIR